jgi:hypothetical protein
MCKVINFLGSPSAGKSTNAAILFGLLKRRNIKCELIVEYAKEIVYRGDLNTLSQCQPLIFGKQHHRLVRACKHVDFCITDSPLILSSVYGEDMPESFRQSVIDIYHRFNNLNYFIKLDPTRYKQYGRTQTVDESLEIEKKILSVLTNCGIYATMVVDAEDVLANLELQNLI